MPKETFRNFEIPDEMRKFAEQGLTQARQALDNYITAAGQAVSNLEDRAEVTRQGALQVAQKSIDYAEQNVAASFDFAEKLMRTTDPSEIMKLQTEFLSGQLRVFAEQMRDIGQGAAKLAMKAAVGE
jgi:phasin